MFFSLEKKKYMMKNMKMILTNSGKHITDQKSILEEQTKFYKNLYSKDKNVSFKLCRGKTELTIDELFDAVMTLKSNKCPGGNGLTNKFY